MLRPHAPPCAALGSRLLLFFFWSQGLHPKCHLIHGGIVLSFRCFSFCLVVGCLPCCTTVFWDVALVRAVFFAMVTCVLSPCQHVCESRHLACAFPLAAMFFPGFCFFSCIKRPRAWVDAPSARRFVVTPLASFSHLRACSTSVCG